MTNEIEAELKEPLIITCDYCGKILDKPGALIFHPPVKDMCRKEHACYECFYSRPQPQGMDEKELIELAQKFCRETYDMTGEKEEYHEKFGVLICFIKDIICQHFHASRLMTVEFPEKRTPAKDSIYLEYDKGYNHGRMDCIDSYQHALHNRMNGKECKK